MNFTSCASLSNVYLTLYANAIWTNFNYEVYCLREMHGNILSAKTSKNLYSVSSNSNYISTESKCHEILGNTSVTKLIILQRYHKHLHDWQMWLSLHLILVQTDNGAHWKKKHWSRQSLRDINSNEYLYFHAVYWKKIYENTCYLPLFQ